jgi:hypothetical protein
LSVEGSLQHVDPVKLAQAWENKVWATKYEVTFELDKYVDAIEQEIADLDIWIQHWDSELGGEDNTSLSTSRRS